MISWATRGQFSYDGNIKATTGLQRNNYTKDELRALLHDTFNTSGKSLEYIQRTLRSGLDILKEGGSVTTVYKDKIFRMYYDNRKVMGNNYCMKELRYFILVTYIDS